MKTKLTSRIVKTLQPKEKLYSVRDTEITGFMLRVSPSGSKVYYMDYKTRAGTRKSYKIGDSLTPAQARDVAKNLAADIAHGKDIQFERKKELRRTKQS
jgi:hypothetical protein